MTSVESHYVPCATAMLSINSIRSAQTQVIGGGCLAGIKARVSHRLDHPPIDSRASILVLNMLKVAEIDRIIAL
jgi:hypothetical protein